MNRLRPIIDRLAARRAQGLPITQDEADLEHLLLLVKHLSRPDALVVARALGRSTP